MSVITGKGEDMYECVWGPDVWMWTFLHTEFSLGIWDLKTKHVYVSVCKPLGVLGEGNQDKEIIHVCPQCTYLAHSHIQPYVGQRVTAGWWRLVEQLGIVRRSGDGWREGGEERRGEERRGEERRGDIRSCGGEERKWNIKLRRHQIFLWQIANPQWQKKNAMRDFAESYDKLHHGRGGGVGGSDALLF